MSKQIKYILSMAVLLFIAIPVVYSLTFGLGYLIGLGVEWGTGQDIVLGPLRLPTWMGIAFCVAYFVKPSESKS